jgi:RNA polymerase sigma-70 factor (ECF subfamily)
LRFLAAAGSNEASERVVTESSGCERIGHAPPELAVGAEPGGTAREALPEAIARAKRGDVAAFEELYRSHVARVYALCLRMHANREDAEDSTQEVFVRAWQRLGSFEGRSAFSTWLHRLAVNVVLDRKRALKHRLAEVWSPIGEPAEDTIDRDKARTTDPGIGLDLERAIATLPDGARLVFVLHDVEGFRHREIAEMTGTAEGTSKAQLHRARQLLRKALNR